MSDIDYRKFIPIIAAEDTERVLKKDEEYGASWKKRGGVGAYMVMIRKVDRLEEQCKKHGYDIFKAIQDRSTGEGLLDTIRDLRSYLDLIEADVRANTFDAASLGEVIAPTFVWNERTGDYCKCRHLRSAHLGLGKGIECRFETQHFSGIIDKCQCDAFELDRERTERSREGFETA